MFCIYTSILQILDGEYFFNNKYTQTNFTVLERQPQILHFREPATKFYTFREPATKFYTFRDPTRKFTVLENQPRNCRFVEYIYK